MTRLQRFALGCLPGVSVVTALSFALPANAQVPALAKGSMLVGGHASINVQDFGDDDENATTFQLLPAIQFFVSRGLAIGGELQLAHSSRGDLSSWVYGIGPAISYYFVGSSNLHPFLRASLRYARYSFESDISDGDSNALGARGAAGVLALFTQSVGLDVGLYYDRAEYSNGTDFDESNFGLALGISAFVF